MQQLPSSIFRSLAFLSFLGFLFACHTAEQDDELNALYDLSTISSVDIEKGEKLFKVSCARCHGINAEGGNAPSLRRQSLQHAPNDEALFNVIQYGIPGTEMPGTWLLTTPDIRLIAGYLRSIGEVKNEAVKGNVSNGKKLYAEKGGCVACHMIDGEGGSLGPDLSKVGSRRPSAYMHQMLLAPGFAKQEGARPRTASGFIDYLVFTVVTKEGKMIQGMRVNEDSFTLQLRDAANNYHSLKKSNLKKVTKEYGKSLMPSMKGILNDGELDDLVAYMVSLK